MDRYWLLTSTTYGTWLPGDERGFVSRVLDDSGQRTRHNVPGAPFDADLPRLRHKARNQMKGPAVFLTREQAQVLLRQFRETALHRGWLLLAAAIMANHFHVVLGVAGDPRPDALLRDLKSYGSRALNRRWSRPESGTWWTTSASRRRLPDEPAVLAAVEYVRRQPKALVVWIEQRSREETGSGDVFSGG